MLVMLATLQRSFNRWYDGVTRTSVSPVRFLLCPSFYTHIATRTKSSRVKHNRVRTSDVDIRRNINEKAEANAQSDLEISVRWPHVLPPNATR